MLMVSSPTIIASLLLTVWCSASPHTVLSGEAKPPIQIQSSLRLDQASSASVLQNSRNTGLAIPHITLPDDGRSRGTEIHKNYTNTTSTNATPATDTARRATTGEVATQPPTKPPRKKSRSPTPSPTSPPIDDDTLGDDAATDTATTAPTDQGTTQPPTKPPRKKSRAPTPSPTFSSPIDDDTRGDDAAPIASDAPIAAPGTVDTKPPISLLVPSPYPEHPVPPTMAPTLQKLTTSPVPVPLNTPTYARIVTVQPSAAYVPIDDDPIVTQNNKDEEDKEEVELEHVQTEAKTAGSIGFLLALCGMIFTAHQMSENPDGIYASVCRLAITIIGCAFKLILMPCRNFLGYRYHAGHIPVSTMEYREPYRGGNTAMEMT